MTISKIPLPLFTFLLKDSSGAVFLQHGDDLFMPFFTSQENAELFARRGALECVVQKLGTLKDVKAFVKRPTSRAPETKVDFRIAIDPIDPKPGTLFLFTREQFLTAVKAD